MTNRHFYNFRLTLITTVTILCTCSFTFTNISVNEGLSHNIVVSCCQDDFGHMWFATHDGLNRYDGYRFKTYRKVENDSTTIADNIIRKVHVDCKGNVWIGTEKGLTFYDRDQDRFCNYRTKGLAVTDIIDIDNGSKLLIAAGGSIKVFNTILKEWDNSYPLDIKESFGANVLYEKDNEIYIGTQQDGLFFYSLKDAEFRKISEFKSRKSIQCILKDDNGVLWVGTEGDGLISISLSDNKSTTYKHAASDPESINSNYVRALSIDADGRIWVGAFNGLSILEHGKFINLQSDQHLQGSLSQSSIRCISRDSQGGMWLGTWLGGINYWHPLKNRFSNIRNESSGKSLNDNTVSCITEAPDGTLLIGTQRGGVNHYNISTGKFKYYSLQNNMNSTLESNDIKAIYVDRNTGNIYVGAHAGGLSIINPKTEEVYHINHRTTEGVPVDVYSIIPATEHYLWIGTLDGLWLYNSSDLKFTRIHDKHDPSILEKLRIRSLLEDSQERLWVGGENGLRCYAAQTEGDISDILPDFVETALNHKFVQCVFESSTKQIWVSTRDGIYCYDEREQSLLHYTKNDGLPSNVIHGMEEDSFGRLWISTDNGLCCFNPFSGNFRNFYAHDGLQGNQFNTYSHCRRVCGEMIFGGMNGITIFSPESLKDNPFTPMAQITGLRVFNNAITPGDESGILKRNIIQEKHIDLKHNQNSITFEICVPNYLAGKHNTFAYKLEGFDKEWHITNQESITYSNLTHGTYQLKIKAANNDNKWNDTPAVMEVRIAPIWYKTIAANCLWGLLIILLIAFAYHVIVERKERESKIQLDKQEKAHQEDIHQMKMRFFINISHEMRTPLTLILNPLHELIQKSNDTWMRKQLRYVERNAKRLMHLVNQLMDYRRAELGVFKLKIRPENVHKIIKENWSYYEILAQNKKIQYHLFSELDGKTLHVDGQYLELILNNLLSNAFKYTEQGSITVRAVQHEDELCIEVSDTGAGIPENERQQIFERFYQIENEHIGTGIGLSLVKKLVDLHHGRITLKSEQGVGSTFAVFLPMTLNAYSPEELGDDSEVHTINSLDYYLVDTDRPEQETAQQGEHKKGKILIAEDNEEIRTYMCNGLSSAFDIIMASNGEEALKLVKENTPDIVITDMMMPIMDGLKLCAAIKQSISTSHIPVIMLSAKTDSKDQLEALKTGADDYMTKPFSMAVLLTKVQNILRTYHRMQDKTTKSMDISPEKISYNAQDELLLRKAISIVENNLDNSDFSTEEFAQEMNMSRSNLHLKLKALTGESALDFIRKIRFKEACRLLKDGRYSISEISDMVGFNTPSYFATCFKKYMGVLPTEYVKNQK